MGRGKLATNIIGQKFGKLTALKMLESNKHKKKMWLCLCECGNEKEVVSSSLTHGLTKSCGCLQSELTTIRLTKHGQAKAGLKTAEYKCWKGITQRCENIKDSAYHNYGGRGILICERWKNFDNFYADMGEKPSPKHSIERNDVNGNYEPNNCRWATANEQARNKRISIINTSGVIGVNWSEKDSRWITRITIENQRIYLGSFKELEEAKKAREQAEIKYWNKLPS